VTAFGDVLRQATKLALGRGLAAALAIPRLVLVAQLFGAAAFGRYSLLSAYGMVGVVLVEVGLKTAAPRRAARDPAQADALTAQLVVVQGVIALVLAGLPAAVGVARPAEAAFLLAFFLGPAATSAGVVRRGLGDSGLESRVEGMLAVARLAPVLLALVAPLDFDAVLWGTLAAVCAVLPFARLRVRARGAHTAWRGLLGEGLTLLLAAAASQLFARVDVIILGWFTGDLEVAHYSAAALALQALGLGTAALAAAAIPWLAAVREESGDAAMFAVAARRCVVVVGATAAAAAVAAVAGLALLPGLVGVDVAAGVMWPVALSAAPAAGSYWLFTALATAERSRAFTSAVAVTLGANVLLDVLVIPRYASAGAATATLVSEAALFALTLRAVRARQAIDQPRGTP